MEFHEQDIEIIKQALRTYYGYLMQGEADALMDDARQIFAERAEKTAELIILLENSSVEV